MKNKNMIAGVDYSLNSPAICISNGNTSYKNCQFYYLTSKKKWEGKITNNITVRNGSKFISIDKSNVSLEIDFEIKYSNSLIGNQKNKLNIYESDLSDIYNSRTFCLYEDIEKLREMGLAKGGNLKNAIVVKNNEILNEDGLRNNLEFVNHKILDCMGDLYLAGHKIIGSIKCSQGGHNLTNQLLRKVFKDKNNFSIFEIKEKTIPHTFIDKSVLKSIA